ncbi:MAG: hypothetical protein IMZ53_03735, partial [Thermoplasmata archaeon]|nr:hypothetical protein [Thermoplasmata archaeon]
MKTDKKHKGFVSMKLLSVIIGILCFFGVAFAEAPKINYDSVSNDESLTKILEYYIG